MNIDKREGLGKSWVLRCMTPTCPHSLHQLQNDTHKHIDKHSNIHSHIHSHTATFFKPNSHTTTEITHQHTQPHDHSNIQQTHSKMHNHTPTYTHQQTKTHSKIPQPHTNIHTPTYNNHTTNTQQDSTTTTTHTATHQHPTDLHLHALCNVNNEIDVGKVIVVGAT